MRDGPDDGISYVPAILRDPELKDPREVQGEGGDTGGFMPMRWMSEYAAVPMDEGGNYLEGYEDRIANSVWRPRRTGERGRGLEIPMDMPDWRSERKFLGGVDCGAGPYPVCFSWPLYLFA